MPRAGISWHRFRWSSTQGFEPSQYSATGKASPVQSSNFLSDDSPFSFSQGGILGCGSRTQPWGAAPAACPTKKEKLSIQMRLAALPNSIFYLLHSLTIFFFFFKLGFTPTHASQSAAAAPLWKSCSVEFHGICPPKVPFCPQPGSGAATSHPAAAGDVTGLCLTCHVTLGNNSLEICANNCFDWNEWVWLVSPFFSFFFFFFFPSRISYA